MRELKNFMGSHKQVCQKHFQLGKVSTTRRTFWLYFPLVSYESNQTMLWPAVHHGKDTTHKTLSTTCIHKMCNNNIKFIEMLGVNGSNVWPVSSQQHATTYNSMCKWTQHVTSNNVVSICMGLNPLSASSDQDQFSPNNIHTLSTDKLWELIKWSPKEKCLDLLSNSLNSFFKEMYGDQFGELVCGYWGLKVNFWQPTWKEKDKECS